MVAERRKDLRRLVDELPDDQVEPAIHLLQQLEGKTDPLIRLLREAPEEDEALSAGELERLKEGEEALARGDVVSDEEVRRELGL